MHQFQIWVHFIINCFFYHATKLHIYKSNHACISFDNDTVNGMVFFRLIKILHIEMPGTKKLLKTQ